MESQLTGLPLLTYACVVLRLGGMLVPAPLPVPRTLPLRFRLLLVLGLGVLITPLQAGIPDACCSWSACLPLLLRELMLGLALGLAVLILSSGLQLAGALVGQLSGLQLADVFDPGQGGRMPLFGRLFDLVAVACFLLTGGHRQMLCALLDSFRWMPPGQGRLPRDTLLAVLEVAGESFDVALRMAAPWLLALLLTVLVLGLAGRAIPQLNVLALGFHLNTLVALAVGSLAVGAVGYVFQARLAAVWTTLTETLQAVPPAW